MSRADMGQLRALYECSSTFDRRPDWGNYRDLLEVNQTSKPENAWSCTIHSRVAHCHASGESVDPHLKNSTNISSIYWHLGYFHRSLPIFTQHSAQAGCEKICFWKGIPGYNANHIKSLVHCCGFDSWPMQGGRFPPYNANSSQSSCTWDLNISNARFLARYEIDMDATPPEGKGTAFLEKWKH